ncbi:MAG: glycerol kinase, partial [Burkholderiaceae bacterium]
ARGAAGLAGLACGFWADEAELAAQWEIEKRFEPQWSEDRRLARLARWRQAVDLSRGWAKPAT